MFLGAINVLVVTIAYGLGGEEGALLVFVFGIVPGMGTGALLGFVGELIVGASDRSLARARGAGVGAVAVLGDFFAMHSLILYASIPTLVIATILEQKTRANPVPPAIPVARAS